MSTIYKKKVIIVGKTGNGKSSLGNTLLGRKAFLASDDFNAVTKECQLEEDIGKITVVDTPGLFDTLETSGNLKTKITSNALSILKSLDVCCKPHAFLFTLNGACRLTDEELSVIDVLTIIFGKKWADHAIVVVTHIENDVEESYFKKKWDNCEKIKEFVEECNGRICRIDNKRPNKEHVRRILANVNQVSQNGTRQFSIEYGDCRKMVLENEDKLENYNGMPTHIIIRDLCKKIEKSIAEEVIRKHKEEEEAKSRLKKRNKKIKDTVKYSTTTATVLATALTAGVGGPAVAVGAVVSGLSIAANVGCGLAFEDSD